MKYNRAGTTNSPSRKTLCRVSKVAPLTGRGWRYRGPLEVEVLKRALSQAARRHQEQSEAAR
jgi:hypothetical protein